MNIKTFDKLSRRESFLLRKIEQEKAKLDKCRRSVKTLYESLLRVGRRGDTEHRYFRQKHSVLERALLNDNRFSLVLAKLIRHI